MSYQGLSQRAGCCHSNHSNHTVNLLKISSYFQEDLVFRSVPVLPEVCYLCSGVTIMPNDKFDWSQHCTCHVSRLKTVCKWAQNVSDVLGTIKKANSWWEHRDDDWFLTKNAQRSRLTATKITKNQKIQKTIQESYERQWIQQLPANDMIKPIPSCGALCIYSLV